MGALIFDEIYEATIRLDKREIGRNTEQLADKVNMLKPNCH